MGSRRRLVVAAALALTAAGCGNPAGPVEPGAGDYVLVVDQAAVAPTQHVFNRGDEYSFTLTVRVFNRSNKAMRLEPCTHVGDAPFFAVELAGGAGSSAYADSRAPTCRIGDNVIVVPAYDSRTDTLTLRSGTYLFDPFDGRGHASPDPAGAVVGRMRISYAAALCATGEPSCELVQVRSNAFEVTRPAR